MAVTLLLVGMLFSWAILLLVTVVPIALVCYSWAVMVGFTPSVKVFPAPARLSSGRSYVVRLAIVWLYGSIGFLGTQVRKCPIPGIRWHSIRVAFMRLLPLN